MKTIKYKNYDEMVKEMNKMLNIFNFTFSKNGGYGVYKNEKGFHARHNALTEFVKVWNETYGTTFHVYHNDVYNRASDWSQEAQKAQDKLKD